VKPTSIIYIIISVVLIIAGFVTMSLAGQLADSGSGVSLTPGDDGDYLDETVNGDIISLNINVKKVKTITIKRMEDEVIADESINEDAESLETADNSGAETDSGTQAETQAQDDRTSVSSSEKESKSARIKMENFTRGMYNYEYKSSKITIEDNYDVTTVAGLFSYVTNFEGFRHYLNYHKTADLEKTIEIEVRGSVKIKCELLEGDVIVEGIDPNTDCDITIHKGNLTVKADGEASFADDNGGTLTAFLEDGNAQVDSGAFSRYSISFGETVAASDNKDGDDDQSTAARFNESAVEKYGEGSDIKTYVINTAKGSLTVDGEVPVECTVVTKYYQDIQKTVEADYNEESGVQGIDASGADFVEISVIHKNIDESNDETAQNGAEAVT